MASKVRGRRRPGPRGDGDLELLGRVVHFRSVPRAELRRLARRCRSRILRRDELLFEEGQPCGGLFVIAAGAVAVRQVSFRGREQVLHAEGPGATLGEGPLFDREGYIASAAALEPTRVLFLPRADLVSLCRRHPAVALSLLESMARRLRHFAGLVGDLALRSVLERLARHLDDAVVSQGRTTAAGAEVTLTLTQAELAARLGTVRELIARAFSRLQRSGVITRAGSHVVIRDRAGLAALARGIDCQEPRPPSRPPPGSRVTSRHTRPVIS
jgi:CRP-like cAMP-binding protein